jgi:hypothetical protein
MIYKKETPFEFVTDREAKWVPVSEALNRYVWSVNSLVKDCHSSVARKNAMFVIFFQ